MKQFCKVIFLLLCFSQQITAQTNSVLVNLQVIPPYSPYLSTYVDQPNKILLTLTNISRYEQDIRLWAQISGDNGVSITTLSGFKPAQPIHLIPGGVLSIDFNSPETKDYFDVNNVSLTGITKSQLIQNQALPEGNYQICVKAFDYATGTQQLSLDGTGCANFPVYYIDPPQPIQPVCGTDVNESTPQFVMFNWTPPATAPGNIQYEFTLKEVPNNLNPYDVIKNNVFPVIYNVTQTANNTLVYTVALPALEGGKKYVWQVKAIDPNNGVQFKNGGYSDACWFNYKKTEAVLFSNNDISANNAPAPPSPTLISPVAQFFGNTYIMKGTLKYFFQSYKPDEKFPLNKVPVSAIIRYKLVTGGYTKWLTANDLPLFTDVDKVLYQSQTDANGNFTFPVTVDNDLGLVAKNQTISAGYNLMGGGPSDYTGDLYRVLQVRVDDDHYCNPEDEITANDKIAQKLDLLTRVRDYKLTYTVKTGLADFSGIYGQLQINGLNLGAATGSTGSGSSKSSSGSSSASINAANTNFFQTGTGNIGSYFYGQMQNIPSYFSVGNSDNQDGEYYVSIYRKYRPAAVPYNEGQTGSSQTPYEGMTPVATGVTSSGKITFNRLVKNTGPDDEYFIKVEPVANANGAKLEQQFQFRYEPDPTVKPPFSEKDYAYFNNEYKTLNIDFSQTNNETVPATSALWGKMTYSYPGYGGESNLIFANQTIKLVVQYAVKTSSGMVNISGYDSDIPGNGQTLATTKTDAEGKFVFNMYDEKDFGLLKSNTHLEIGSQEIPDQYDGDLYRYIKVVVTSPHFNSPDDNITIVPGFSKDLGTLNAVAKTYALSVNLVSNKSVKNQLVPPGNPVSEMDVYLIRYSTPEDIYTTEGGNTQLNLTYGGYEVVDRKTSDANGNVRFDNLFKNIGDEDNYWIVAEPNAQSSKNYTSGWAYFHVKYDGTDFNWYKFSGSNHDYAYFNSQYKYPVVSRELVVDPLKPEITGRVVREDNTIKGIYHATVELMGLAIIIPVKESEEYSDFDGKFSFTGLSTQYDNNGQFNGYLRLIDISAAGFKKKTVNNLPFLKDGMRVNLGDIPVKPASIVKGQVIEDIHESPISAKVTIGAGATVETTPVSWYIPSQGGGIKYFGGTFESPSAMLPIQVMHVTPNSDKFYDEWLPIVVDKPEVDLGKVKVYKKIHRIRVKITTPKEEGGGKKKTQNGGIQVYNPNSTPVSLKNFRVVVKNNTDTVLTNEAGIAEFKFESSSNQFQIKVYGPQDQDWEPKTVAVTNSESKNFNDVPIEMKAATKIYGQVAVGSSPVAGARVFLDESLEDPIETKTNTGGFYVLHNVPKKSGATFKAVKSSSNLVGDEKTISTYNVSDSVNFNLKVYDKIDITKMLNLPIEVESLKEDGGGVKISGAFTNLPANDHFKLDNDLRLKFSDISIKEGTKKNAKGVGYAVPVDDHVDIDEKNSIDLKVNNTFNGVQGESTDWLRVNKLPDDEGGLVGKVFIKDLATSSIKFDTDPALGMSSGGTTKLKITSTASLPKNPSWLPDNYLLVNNTGGNVTFKAYDLTAEASATNSYLKNDVLDFNTTIKAVIPTLSNPNVSVNIGSLKVHQSSIEPVTGSAKVSLNLENWKLTSTDWTFNSNGFNMQKGNLEMEGMNIPFKNIKVEKDNLSYATTNTFDLNNLTMLGVIPVTANGPSQFGYNSGHWQLNVTADGSGYGAVMKNIPGMQGGSDLKLESIKLKSDGTKEYKIKSQTRTLFNLASYYINNGLIGVYSDYINIPGMVDLNVPLVSVQPTSFVISKTGGTLSSKLESFGFGFTTSGIKLNFSKGKMTFANGSITSEGTASEDGVFSHDVKLFKTTDSIAINTIPGQTFNITKSGSQKFTNIFGRMVPTGSSVWSKYYFDGDLTGSEGASGRIRNTVYGDIKIDNQKVGVQNISTPFGNLNMVYDLAEGKLVGTLDVNESLGQGGSLTAHVETLFGSLGWYFCSGGTCVFPNNPYIKNMNVALVFGSYPVGGEPTITNTFKTYSYTGALPVSFASNLKGFFVDGKGTFPVPYVPDIDIDLVVLSAGVGADITGDYSIGMNFASGTVLYTGSAIKLHVWVSVGGSIGIACAGAGGEVSAELKAAGELHSDGQFAIDGTFTVTLGANAYCGVGCCDSDCDDCCDFCIITHCFKDDWSGDKSIGATAHMDNSGASFNVNW